MTSDTHGQDAFEHELLERFRALVGEKQAAFLEFALAGSAVAARNEHALLEHVRSLSPQRRFALLAFMDARP